MGTFFKNVWGYFTENKIPFLPFFVYAIPIPITQLPHPHSLPHHSLIHPHILSTIPYSYSVPSTPSILDLYIPTHSQTLLINIHNIIYIIYIQPTIPEKNKKKEKLRFWLAVRQTKSQASS